MTDQHRASPELWAAAEKFGANTMDMMNCVLELRSRVELLEATQHAHVDTSQLAEARQPTFAELLMPRVFTADEVAPIVVPTVNKSLIADLSPAAQAVLDAAEYENCSNDPASFIAIATLRAAADGCSPDWMGLTVIHHLYALADELEGK